jgi:hypothetical protein
MTSMHAAMGRNCSTSVWFRMRIFIFVTLP